MKDAAIITKTMNDAAMIDIAGAVVVARAIALVGTVAVAVEAEVHAMFAGRAESANPDAGRLPARQAPLIGKGSESLMVIGCIFSSEVSLGKLSSLGRVSSKRYILWLTRGQRTSKEKSMRQTHCELNSVLSPFSDTCDNCEL